MKHKLSFGLVLFFAFTLVSFVRTEATRSASTQEKFELACKLPFDVLKEHHPIDAECSVQGEFSTKVSKEKQEAQKLQNMAKNNFCGQNKPIPITFSTLSKLQAATAKAFANEDIPWGSGLSLPPDRSILEKGFTIDGKHLGEGTVVTLVAYVLDARHSNVSKGENNNCNLSKRENNDIHIELASKRGVDPCYSATAEVSPHWRPESWDLFDTYSYTTKVKITGQLFFDASHRPCTFKADNSILKTTSPARFTVWEIHPVYDIQIQYKQNWMSYNKWLELPDIDDEN